MKSDVSPALPAALVAWILADSDPTEQHQRQQQQWGQHRGEHVDLSAHFNSSRVKPWWSPPPCLQLHSVSICPLGTGALPGVCLSPLTPLTYLNSVRSSRCWQSSGEMWSEFQLRLSFCSLKSLSPRHSHNLTKWCLQGLSPGSDIPASQFNTCVALECFLAYRIFFFFDKHHWAALLCIGRVFVFTFVTLLSFKLIF